jgi:hypothetical protein
LAPTREVVQSAPIRRDFFDPTPEEQKVWLIDAATLRMAKKPIESCEHCGPEGAEIPFDNILYRVTGSDLSVTDYNAYPSLPGTLYLSKLTVIHCAKAVPYAIFLLL